MGNCLTGRREAVEEGVPPAPAPIGAPSPNAESYVPRGQFSSSPATSTADQAAEIYILLHPPSPPWGLDEDNDAPVNSEVASYSGVIILHPSLQETIPSDEYEPPITAPAPQLTLQRPVSAGPDSVLKGAHDFALGSLSSTYVGGDHITNIYQGEGWNTTELDAIRNETRQWLNAPSFLTIHQGALEQRADKTGTWFLESDEFHEFKEWEGAVLWCTGKPGSGKTILASTSIEYLQDMVRPYNGDMAVIYVYLRYSEQHTLTLREILVAMLDQLLALDDAVAIIEPSYRQMKRARSAYTLGMIISTMKDIIIRLSKVYAVLDGLDEASDEVKDALLLNIPALGANVSLLIFSRPLELYGHHIPDAATVSIQARTDDIALYISEQVETRSGLIALLGGDMELVEELCARIKEQADGMFLLARLQLESAMQNATSAKSLFDLLEKMPSGIDDMYDLTMKRINDQPEARSSLAHRLFVWLLSPVEEREYPEVILSTGCIQEALAVSIEDRTYDKLDITPVELILSSCHGLVTLTQDDPAQFRFIHYSAQEYVKRIPFPAIPNPQSFLAATCIVYMDPHVDSWIKDANSEEQEDPDFTSNVILRRSYTSFLDYARRNWGHHVRLCQQQGEPLHPTILWSLSRHSAFPLEVDGEHLMIESLSVAAWYGLLDIIESRSLPLAAPRPRRRFFPHRRYNFSTPLHSAASSHQFDAFISLLSTYGSEAQSLPLWACSEDNEMSTVLHSAIDALPVSSPGAAHAFLQQLLAAVQCPSVKSAMPLAFSNFNINAQDHQGITPLMLACECAELDVIHLLVKHGADLNVADSIGRTAFLCTLDQGQGRFDTVDAVVEALEYFLGLDPLVIDQCNQWGKTSLMIAICEQMHPTVVGFLLSRSQSCLPDPAKFVNARDCNGLTALMRTTTCYDATRTTYEVGLCPHFADLLTLPSLDIRLTDRWGRGVLEVCMQAHLLHLHDDPVDDRLFPTLYALLAADGGWGAVSVRRAVIAGVGYLPPGAVYRLLLEDWVLYSFSWTTDHPETVALLIRAYARTATCRAALRIVLYHLGLLEASLLPGGVQASDFTTLAKAFCRRRNCPCACRVEGDLEKRERPRLAAFLAMRRSYTTAELKQRISLTNSNIPNDA